MSASLSNRIRGIVESLECGDGGVRRDLDAALAEVDALMVKADAYREAVEALREARGWVEGHAETGWGAAQLVARIDAILGPGEEASHG